MTYTHQQVGVAKQGNRTILNIVKSILDDSGLLLKYQEFAAVYYIYIQNRTWSSRLKKTSYKEQFRKEPDVSGFKVFRSIAYVHNFTEPDNQHKLLSTAQKGIFVGFGGSGYRVQDLINKKIVVFRYVKVIKNKFGSDWLKELAVASLSIRNLESNRLVITNNNTSELLSNIIIILYLFNKANLSYTDNGLSALNIAKIKK